MGRRQTKVSAFKVFQKKRVKTMTEQIKSSEHLIKKKTICRGKNPSKNDTLSGPYLTMSLAHKSKRRGSYEESSSKDECFESVSDKPVKRKHQSKRRGSYEESSSKDECVKSVSDKPVKRKHQSVSWESSVNSKYDAEDAVDKSHESILVKSVVLTGKKQKELMTDTLKREKKQANISTADVKDDKVKTSKKTDKSKTRSPSRCISGNPSIENNNSEMFSNKSKRKHRDKLLQLNVKEILQEEEGKTKKKKMRLSNRRNEKPLNEDESVSSSKQLESVGSSEKLDDVSHEESTDEMVPEIIDVNVTGLPSVLQIKDGSIKLSRPKSVKKLRKIKSASDINKPTFGKKMSRNASFSILTKQDKSLLVSKWKTNSKTSNAMGLRCSSSLPFQAECFDLDEHISEEECSPTVTSSKLGKTDLVKSNSVKELDVLSDGSASEGEFETELSPSNQLSLSEDLNTTGNSTEILFEHSSGSPEEDIEMASTLVEFSAVDVLKTHSKPGILAQTTKRGAVLLLLSHPQKLCLQGKVLVKALHGSVSVLQYDITTDSPTCRVFSPSSNSLLTLETRSGKSLDELKPSIKNTPEVSTFFKPFDSRSDQLFVLLKLNMMDSVCLDYLSNFVPYTNLFSLSLDPLSAHNKVLKSVGLAVSPPDDVSLSVLSLSDKYTRSIDKWVSLIKHSEKPPIVLVCAGKNCGKSTAARMLVNAALNVIEEVCFLECDVGQSELTPSGCISLHKLTEPLLGPPFTHQREAYSKCFFGGLSPSDNPSLYVTQLEYVYEFYKNMRPSVPLIVNTMGWTEGLGLCLLIDTIHVTSPTLVIQLDSKSNFNNFRPITPQYVAHEQGWLFNKNTVSENGEQNHELIRFKSRSDNMQRVIVKWKPEDHRNMSMLSYLCGSLESGMSLNSLTPYTVPWSAVGVHVCHYAVKASQVLCALNASVVALCQADLSQAHRSSEDSPWLFDKIPVCQCLGLGIVRGIDVELKELYIITPLSLETVRHVNAILKGNNVIPSNVLSEQRSTGFIPYVDKVVMTKAAGKFRSRRIARR